MGQSFGNARIWVTTKSTGAIERAFSTQLGLSLCGAISIRYAGTGNRLHPTWAGHPSAAGTYVQLHRDAPAEFELHPAYQRRRFTIAGSVNVSETIFVPLGANLGDDPPLVYQVVELENTDDVVHELRLLAFAHFRGGLSGDVVARYDESLSALVAHNRSRPDAIRIFGLTEKPSNWATTFDFGAVYDPSHVHPLDGKTDAAGDILGALQLDLTLAAHGRFCVAFVTGVYGGDEDDAIAQYRATAAGASEKLTQTIGYLSDVTQAGEVLTPDPQINAGALWSKVNMRRVMAYYPQAHAFTNDPGVSSNVVMRDAAWFVYGNDHFLPSFSRALLDRFALAQYPDGKLPEYYDALDGRIEDDGLNINDGTPLYILAINHHWRATGDAQWVRSIYPSLERAARYILSQCDERGLVYCSANDPRGDVWSIASWRNVIPLYQINGAVTEINSECAAALREAAFIADEVGETQDASEFRAGSEAIQRAMDAHLLNPDTGLYHLNIDCDGNAHTDVTGDEIFPVMFGVCDEETGYRIISRLNAPDFWTPAGLRTASRSDPLYNPSGNLGLIGGVWPGLSWWYAFAAARYHPEFMVRALRASFAHYAADPRQNNTVPGQFSEWFDGESLVNRGMRLSPWEPPRFLWAAIEGVCGLSCEVGAPSVNPLVPPTWKWVALRRQPYHGSELTYFAARQEGRFHIYSTVDVSTEHLVHRYNEDVSWGVSVFSDAAAVLALRRPGRFVILVGSVGTTTATIPLNIRRLIEDGARYRTRMYNSEREAWEDGGVELGADISSLSITVETQGYRLLELRVMPSEDR